MAHAYAPLGFRERRAAERVPTTLRGKAFPTASPGGRDCQIIDFSKRGARLRFEGDLPADDRMVVVVWSSGLAFQAQMRWRRADEMGVQFTGSRDLRRPAPPELEAIRALWLRRRPRLRRQAIIANPMILRQTKRWPRRLIGAQTDRSL